MSEFYAFASDNPSLTFFLAYVIGELAYKFFRAGTKSITIWLHGYPPMWCDVDGDFPKTKKGSDDE